MMKEKKCYLVRGLPGTGKTTISNMISELTGYDLLRTDEIRKKLQEENKLPYNEKALYNQKNKQVVYAELERMLMNGFENNENKILDGAFNSLDNIKKIQEICKNKEYSLVILECICDEKVVLERLENRVDNLSDANETVYDLIKKKYEPIEETVFYRVDTTKPKNMLSILLKEIIRD